MKRALVIGIDYYQHGSLSGAANDAEKIARLLSRNSDGSVNFETKAVVATDKSQAVTRQKLISAIDELYKNAADTTVLYFAGHGAVTEAGGYIITSEAENISDGYSMREILLKASQAHVKESVIILDCCHSGAFGQFTETNTDLLVMRQGVSLLASSRSNEPSMELNGAGVFTTLVVDALSGGARDVLGRVTVGSIYAYVDMALSAWDQRPVFKANLHNFTPLRRCEPCVDSAILRLLPQYFPAPDAEFPLDPSYEPSIEPKNEKNERTFGHLQRLRDARLLVPVNEKHLYYAAVHSAACKLTELGRFYWQLAKQMRI